MVRLKVQIILCTYCLKGGGRWKHSHGRTEVKAKVREVRWEMAGWCGGLKREEKREGGGSWLFQHRGQRW